MPWSLFTPGVVVLMVLLALEYRSQDLYKDRWSSMKHPAPSHCSTLFMPAYPVFQDYDAEHISKYHLDCVMWLNVYCIDSTWICLLCLMYYISWNIDGNWRHTNYCRWNKMKPTNPNADTYVEKQGFNTYLSQFPANPLVEHPDLTHWGDTLVGHPCLTLLRYALVRHSCLTLWFDTLVGHSCLTLF